MLMLGLKVKAPVTKVTPCITGHEWCEDLLHELHPVLHITMHGRGFETIMGSDDKWMHCQPSC